MPKFIKILHAVKVLYNIMNICSIVSEQFHFSKIFVSIHNNGMNTPKLLTTSPYHALLKFQDI